MNSLYLRCSLLKLLSFLFVASPVYLQAQTVSVSGNVKSTSFLVPINRAIITTADGKMIARTNIDGKFKFQATKGDLLIFNRSGYISEKLVVDSSINFAVLMQENPLGPDSTYQTLFGYPIKRKLSTAALSEIYGKELEQTNSRSTSGLLVGRIPGLYSNQSTGEPGADNVSLSLRGSNPLVMVDGVPQSFGAINPEQIESITLMKDALSTAMLGMRASNGVLYIKTKQGKDGEQNISFKVQTGFQQPVKLPKTLSSYNYAVLYNEASRNSGGSSSYGPEALAAYKDGSDPYSYPDVNWQDEILQDQSKFSRYDLGISGGGKTANYFVNLDYLNQGGLLKTSDVNTYNTNADFKRYGFRTNLGVNMSKILSTNLNLAAQIQNGNEPGSTVPSIFSSILSTPNNAFPILNPDGSLGGNVNYTTNPWGQAINSGYRPYTQAEFKTDLSLKADLGLLTKGLWAKATAAYKTYLFENINRSKGYGVYQMSVNPAGDTTYIERAIPSSMLNASSVAGRNQMLYTELALGIDRNFGAHGINFLLNASNDNQQTGSTLPDNYRGIAAKASYNYREKYLAEFALGYNGVERYPSSNRYGFFPALGLGWNVAEESFLKNVSWLEQFKLRGSYGLTGNANAGYFVYNEYYELGTSYSIGVTPTTVAGYSQGSSNVPANPNITWEKARKLNIGLDAALFKNKITLTAEYYKNNFYDLLRTPSGSGIFGATYPIINIGKLERTGTEFQILYQDKIGKMNFFIQPNLSFLKSINTFLDELEPQYPWLRQTGLPGGQPFGYMAEGLFQSQAEADASPVIAGYNAQAGDIKYRDLNNDKVIDGYDRTALGHQRPLMFYGTTLGFNVKGFDLNALVQGVENRQIIYTGASVWEFQNSGKSQAFEHHLGRWTPENAVNATYPRLTIGTNINNHISSSYWLKSGDYFRLKSLELGYTLPRLLSLKAGISTARIFLNGTNLFTKSEFDEVDPETGTGGYPMLKMFSGGLNIKF